MEGIFKREQGTKSSLQIGFAGCAERYLNLRFKRLCYYAGKLLLSQDFGPLICGHALQKIKQFFTRLDGISYRVYTVFGDWKPHGAGSQPFASYDVRFLVTLLMYSP